MYRRIVARIDGRHDIALGGYRKIQELLRRFGMSRHGNSGKGGNKDKTPPQSSDGIVPYWSSHLDGAESEVIVPSDHWSNRSPAGIAEVRRILTKYADHAAAPAAPETTKPSDSTKPSETTAQ